MEDVLDSGEDAEPVRLHGNKHQLLHDVKSNEVKCILNLFKTHIVGSNKHVLIYFNMHFISYFQSN